MLISGFHGQERRHYSCFAYSCLRIFNVLKYHLVFSRYGNNKLLEVHFNQSCTQVDLDARTVIFSDVQTGALLPIDRKYAATGIETAGVNGFATASVNGHEEVVHTGKEYDLLVGADGVRSVVRGSMMQHLRRWVCPRVIVVVVWDFWDF